MELAYLKTEALLTMELEGYQRERYQKWGHL